MIKNKKHLLIIIGALLIVGSITTFCLKNKIVKDIKNKEEKSVQSFIVKNNEKPKENVDKKETNIFQGYDYIGVIEIPKLNIKRGFVDKNSRYNDVRYNVQILKESTMPDVEKGNLILAAHSGNTRVSYFRNLKNISLGDEVNIYYQNKKYIYNVVKTYEIEKTGYANIVRDKSKTTLTLITCKSGTNYQIVVICELKEIK